jgi:hypothetical protein
MTHRGRYRKEQCVWMASGATCEQIPRAEIQVRRPRVLEGRRDCLVTAMPSHDSSKLKINVHFSPVLV